MKHRNRFWVTFIVRAILGVGVIFFANYFLKKEKIDVTVGINAVSILTSGVLGLPGVVVLYGISAIPIL